MLEGDRRAEQEIARQLEGASALLAGFDHLLNKPEAVGLGGAELVGELVNYEDSYWLCYVRGPDGIIVELAEKIG